MAQNMSRQGSEDGVLCSGGFDDGAFQATGPIAFGAAASVPVGASPTGRNLRVAAAAALLLLPGSGSPKSSTRDLAVPGMAASPKGSMRDLARQNSKRGTALPGGLPSLPDKKAATKPATGLCPAAPAKGKPSLSRPTSANPSSRRPTSARLYDSSDGKSERQKPEEKPQSKLDIALQALTEHPFLKGLKMGTIVSIARVSVQKTEEAILKAGAEHGKPNVIMLEGEKNWASDMLWIIEKGKVDLFQNGEKLDTLKAGDIFGAAVAFGSLESQPFTVFLHPPKTEHDAAEKLVCWCIPNDAVQYTFEQFPEAKQRLEQRLIDQMKRQLFSRIRSLLFFQHCDVRFVQKLLAKMQLSFYQKGAEIVKGGDAAEVMQMVLTGSVRLGSMTKRMNQTASASSRRISAERSLNTEDIRILNKAKTMTDDSSETPVAKPSWAKRMTRATAERQTTKEKERLTQGGFRAVSRRVSSMHEQASEKGPAGSTPNSWPATPGTTQKAAEGTNTGASGSSWLNRFRNVDTLAAERAGATAGEASEEAMDDGSEDDLLSPRLGESDGESSSSSSSASSTNSLDESAGFLPPKSSQRAQVKLMTAGPEAICFGEGILLGFQDWSGRPSVAASDCIVATLHRDFFLEEVERNPKEGARFQQMEIVRYQEWKRSDIARLASVDLFSQCSDSFLALITQHAKMQLFFDGQNLVAKGVKPEGLLLLMTGGAKQTSEKGEELEVSSPYSHGTLEWLGVSESSQMLNLKAKQVCLVLTISREHLLDALKDHPAESTAMVQQVLHKQGLGRMTITSGLEQLGNLTGAKYSGCGVAASSANNRASVATGKPKRGRQTTWHLPFCRDCDEAFVTMLSIELKACKLVPGQVIFSPPPSGQPHHSGHGHKEDDGHHHHRHHNDHVGEDSDFLVVLTNGTAQVDETPPQHKKDGANQLQSWKQVQAPLIMVGFNRKHRAMMVTSTVCEVHRLSIQAIRRIAEAHPKELKKVLQRMLHFTQRKEEKQKSSWWCHTKSLRHQAWFKDSHEAFLQEIVKNLHTELYLPDEVLVCEGDVADSTMLLECGTVAIERVDSRSLYSTDRIGEVRDGYWIGEMAMFAGESKRRASIKAMTVCKVQRLYNKELVHLLGLYPTERQRFRQLAEHRLRATEKEQLEDYPFFKDFDQGFINMLRQKCRAHVFFADEVLMRQGEPADSLFILGQDTQVTLSVDGVQVKKLTGRACLGTKALLSQRAVKRASTVVTQTVCAVRTLSREDWLDALKLHPEHQRWLVNFTRDQMCKVGEARATFMKKRAWGKIHQREQAATSLHCDRLIDPELYVRQRRNRSRRLPGLCDSRQSVPIDMEADVADSTEECTSPNVSNIAQALPETWECFNGSQVVVPHTRLPTLGTNLTNCFLEADSGSLDRSTRQLTGSGSVDSFVMADCEEALIQASTQR